ncbi:peptide deformylase [Patescibacteria group bacterium]
MTVLKIQTGSDNPILREKSTPIDNIDKSIKKLAKDMLETMNANNGLGIAAPQVGVNKRMFITTINQGTDHEGLITMINPVVEFTNDELEEGEEGCLSLPELFKPVTRHKFVRVKYKDLKNNNHILDLEGLNARVIQHETDHLDGILFIDRVDEVI